MYVCLCSISYAYEEQHNDVRVVCVCCEHSTLYLQCLQRKVWVRSTLRALYSYRVCARSAKQEAPRRHQGEADGAEPGPDAAAQHVEPASAAME